MRSLHKILIMGLSGSGKTTLAQELASTLSKERKVFRLNADEIRKEFNDWDFSDEGRLRQAHRMSSLAQQSSADIVIADFIAPTDEIRQIFAPDILIWMDTETESKFKDTDSIFKKPSKYDYRITEKNATQEVVKIVSTLYYRLA